MNDRPTADEDAVLRRLHWFENFGAKLSPGLRATKASIRSRDKRDVIRDPDAAPYTVGPIKEQTPPD